MSFVNISWKISLAVQIWWKFNFTFNSNSDEVINTQFCTWHDSCTAMACASICITMSTTNEIAARWIFKTIWIVMKNMVSKCQENPTSCDMESLSGLPTFCEEKQLVTNGFDASSTHTKNPFLSLALFTHWGKVMHICVSKLTITGSDNGLLPGRHQAIIWTNAGLFLIWLLGKSFSEISTFPYLHSRKYIWKCRLRNGHFVVTSIC